MDVVLTISNISRVEMERVQCLCGPQGTGAISGTAVIVMVTQTAYTHCQSAASLNKGVSHGTWRSARPRSLLRTVAEPTPRNRL